jgi:hypothetical protein
MEIVVGIITIPYYTYFYGYMNIILIGFGILVYILFIIFHLITSLINPGLPPKKYFLENFNMNQSDIQNYVICRRCKIVMDLDKGTEHCVDCDICVMGNDHHCQWTSKCIGKNNLFFFKCFLRIIIFHIAYMMLSLLTLCITGKQT